MKRKDFERLVVKALKGLPRAFQDRLDSVVVVVEARPSSRLLRSMGMEPDELLLGLYEGTPLTEYGREADFSLPSKITIFQEPVESVCRSPEEMEEEIRRTVIHEIGHHFGLGEEELEGV